LLLYRSVKYIPLALLGARWEALLVVAVIATLIGHLNHANLNISWGPLRYVLNSPKMHVWHHDVEQHGPGGQNFGQVLSVWDWVFGTAYWPEDREAPQKLGFEGMESYPRSVPGRLLYPLSRRRKPSIR
jgi:sterol desaturase/sphingolipid hydroxylase (fatty acid hydroxylase superfamily)